MLQKTIHNERISKSAADRLFRALEAPDCPFSALSHEARLAALQRYRTEKQCLAVPYYDELNELLPRFGLTYRSFFELLGVPCHWPDNHAAKLADALAELDEEELERLRRCTKALLPEVWEQANWEGSPSRRMHLWRFNVTDSEERLRIRKAHKKDFPRFFAESSGRGRVDTEDLWVLGDLYGIPYYFLLGDPPVAVLAASPLIEAIMNDYLRLPESSRHIVEHLVSNATAESYGRTF